MAKAIANTAVAITNALAIPAPPPIPQIIAGMYGAMGATQIAKIAGLEFEFGGLVDVMEAARGAVLKGRRHNQGGIPVEAEDGEVIINRRSAAAFRDQLSAINSYNNWGKPFAVGGMVEQRTVTQQAPQQVGSLFTSDMLDYLIAGINDKKVINDPIEAAQAQNLAARLQQAGVF